MNKSITQKKLFEATFTGPSAITVSAYLKESSPLSGRSLRQYFFKGLVRLNHRKAHTQSIIKPGDIIQVYGVSEEYQALVPEPIPLDVIFENDDLLVINKPALIAVHPSGTITSGTLSNGVAAYFEKTGLKIKIRPINRLDFGTSGLIIFAKNAAIQAKVSEAIQNHRIIRIYYAVVQGFLKYNAGTINLPIGVIKGKRVVTPKGQPAETEYKVIQELRNASLLELNLKTGRTHQIRVHVSHIGHPILGDRQYGAETPFIQRPALHAGKLNFEASSFRVPELTAPHPEDFDNLISALKKTD